MRELWIQVPGFNTYLCRPSSYTNSGGNWGRASAGLPDAEKEHGALDAELLSRRDWDDVVAIGITNHGEAIRFRVTGAWSAPKRRPVVMLERMAEV